MSVPDSHYYSGVTEKVPNKNSPSGRRTRKASYAELHRYARRMSTILDRSFQALPPTHTARFTPEPIGDDDFKRCLAKLTSSLTAKGISWLVTHEGLDWQMLNIENEWVRTRHCHLTLRSNGITLDRSIFINLLNAAFSGFPMATDTYFTDYIRDLRKLAKYIPKDLSWDRRDEINQAFLPGDFEGRGQSSSRDFFYKPCSAIYQEWCAEQPWYDPHYYDEVHRDEIKSDNVNLDSKSEDGAEWVKGGISIYTWCADEKAPLEAFPEGLWFPTNRRCPYQTSFFSAFPLTQPVACRIPQQLARRESSVAPFASLGEAWHTPCVSSLPRPPPG